MTSKEFAEKELDKEIFIALESARDNLYLLIQRNNDQFKIKADNLVPAKKLITAAKMKHQADKSLSLQKVALESYTDCLDLDAEELQFITENINK